jgi:hypothetical protein
MKYIVKDTPENDIDIIKSLAVKTIPGLVSFVPRLNTLEKKGAY